MTQQHTLKVELGLPPSANNAYSNLPRGGRILSLEGRRYKATAESAIMAAACLQKFSYPPKARLSLAINLRFPNNRRRDISNCVKLVEDSLSAALGFDDCVVDILHIERALPKPGEPSCEVVLSVLENV